VDPDGRLGRLADRQHGVVTRSDAFDCGLTRPQINHRVRTGRWERVHPGVFRIVGSPPSEAQLIAAAVRSTDGVASHRSAAHLLGLADRAPRVPHVTVGPSTSARRPGIRVHRSGDLERRDTVTIESIRCTGATRTCIDLGSEMGAETLERVIERAVHAGLTHFDRLVARFLQLARSGRPGITTARAVLRRMDPALEPAESDLETLLWHVLRSRGVPLPVRQHRTSIAGRDIRIDMCYPDRRIAIESDGFASHGIRSAFEGDRERQNLLVIDGWRVLRFTWRQICAQPDWVAEQVRQAIERA
jgi:very-short-patch-repair endonuclease